MAVIQVKKGESFLLADVKKQGDWEQEDINEKDYIKNKPDYKELEARIEKLEKIVEEKFGNNN